MANYLRSNQREQLQRERQWKKTERERNGNRHAPNECPYCHSKDIEPCNAEKLCRNCHRHFLP